MCGGGKVVRPLSGMNMRMEHSALAEGRAYAKVNLRLKIEGRRADGYHLLSMLNATVGLWDDIRVRLEPDPGVRVHCLGGAAELAEVLNDPARNIAGRAASRLLARCELEGRCGVRVEIEKHIPAGAGLGGGSSDAACVLGLLARLLKLRQEEFGVENSALSLEVLQDLALSLGADVPYLMSQGFCHVTGIGEQCRKLDGAVLEQQPLLLVLPAVHVDTGKVFDLMRQRSQCFKPDQESYALDRPGSRPIGYQRLLALLENDLEETVCSEFPPIGQLLAAVRRKTGLVASLTGSGSAFFCLCSGDIEEKSRISLLEEAGKELIEQGVCARRLFFGR